jgi:hypothetical protein
VDRCRAPSASAFRPRSCGGVNVQVHMRRLLKEDRSRHREAAAQQEAGGAEPEELTYRLSQRRQRKRQGRVTDAPAHMPETLSKNSVMQVCDAGLLRNPTVGTKPCTDDLARTLLEPRPTGIGRAASKLVHRRRFTEGCQNDLRNEVVNDSNFIVGGACAHCGGKGTRTTDVLVAKAILLGWTSRARSGTGIRRPVKRGLAYRLVRRQSVGRSSWPVLRLV